MAAADVADHLFVTEEAATDVEAIRAAHGDGYEADVDG
jgi:hypothetical protein